MVVKTMTTDKRDAFLHLLEIGLEHKPLHKSRWGVFRISLPFHQEFVFEERKTRDGKYAIKKRRYCVRQLHIIYSNFQDKLVRLGFLDDEEDLRVVYEPIGFQVSICLQKT
jgi:hypothetical protein